MIANIFLCFLFIYPVFAFGVEKEVEAQASTQGITLITAKFRWGDFKILPTQEDRLSLQGLVTVDAPEAPVEQIKLKIWQEGTILRIKEGFPSKPPLKGQGTPRWILTVKLPQDKDFRIKLHKGKAHLQGSWKGEGVIKMRTGKIIYTVGDISPKDLEARSYLGKVKSTWQGILPRPFYPFGKRILYLNPRGIGKLYLRTWKGTILLQP